MRAARQIRPSRPRESDASNNEAVPQEKLAAAPEQDPEPDRVVDSGDDSDRDIDYVKGLAQRATDPWFKQRKAKGPFVVGIPPKHPHTGGGPMPWMTD